MVSLVGCGCGKGLLTELGKARLCSADCVVYDALLDDEILALCKNNCEKIFVGKRAGSHSKSQDEINEILLENAKKFTHVVRLKGGDSFVFGRGGEECEILQKNGVEFELVPGVSSAIAAPESVGIPVTHRGIARSFTVVTAHTKDGNSPDYSALARLGGTLVFLMGLNKISEISAGLISFGMSENTPCSVISNGCTSDAKRFDGTLETIANSARNATAPAVIVVGDVCRFDFRSKKKAPTVLITGTDSFCRSLAQNENATDFEIRTLETMKIVPTKYHLNDDFSSEYDVIAFTSANGVRLFFDMLKQKEIDIRRLHKIKFACIGTGTAKELKFHGIVTDLMPTEYTAKALGKALADNFAKQNILIFRSADGSKELTQQLDIFNIKYTDLAVYKAVSLKKADEFSATDYIVFGSGSSVEAYCTHNEIKAKNIVCIGKTAEQKLKLYTKQKPLVAQTHNADGIIEVIKENEKISQTQTQ